MEEIIPITVVNAFMGENGWELSKDLVNNKKYLHELYTLAAPNYTGRVTIPILWDKKLQTIVNNESSEIIRMFNHAFNDMTDNIQDYYPKNLQSEIDEINAFIYDTINNGVYKTGFATTQTVYEEEVTQLFDALNIIEKRLNSQRYLVRNQLTEADFRLFTTLLRFDPVYVGHFKCNIRTIADYPHLSNYLRDLYQIEGIKETIHMNHIKTHYYKSHVTINPTGIIPLGPDINYDAPHDRDRFIKN